MPAQKQQCYFSNMTNEIEEIPVEAGKKYLLDVFKDGHLPYGILNKSTPGCGGTTVALESYQDYIVFVPTIELIKNKSKQYSKPEGATLCRLMNLAYEVNIFEVHGDFKSLKDDIEYHIREAKEYKYPVKIMATYDSAPRLLDYLGEDFVKKCNILVDEFHSLMIDYDFRSDAIENLIDALRGHPKTTYMSATPLNPKQGPFQLENLPIKVIKWHNTVKPQVALEKSNSPLKSTRAIIVHDFAGRPVMQITDQQEQPIFPEQYFFFINNVNHIKNIIKGLQHSIRNHICIVCTDNEKNQKTLGDLVNLVGSTSSLKRYNFLTKRAYYGCDIDSQRGLSIVVTNVRSKVTLLDVNTDIIQISGRIRNEENPFKNVMVHIYNKLPENEIQLVFSQFEREQLKSSKSKNTDTENFRRHMLFKHYLYTETYNSLGKEYNIAQIPFYKIDLNLSFHRELTEFYTDRFDTNLEKIYNFYDREGSEEELSQKLRFFLDSHPFINEAINTWGFEKLRSFRFREKEIRKALEKGRKEKALSPQIVNMLKNDLSVGKSYTLAHLKRLIKEIYKSLGIEEMATASHIKRYFEVKQTSIQSEQNTTKTKGAYKILALIE